MILNATAELAKSFTARREKGEDEADSNVTCSLKFSELPVARGEIDELVGLPLGLTERLFDELGAPLAPLTLSSKKRALEASGRVSFNASKLTLGSDCELTDIAVTLKELGGLLEATLTWSALGDETEEVAELLGRCCHLELTVSPPKQGDLIDQARAPGRAATGAGRKRSGNGRPPAGH